LAFDLSRGAKHFVCKHLFRVGREAAGSEKLSEAERTARDDVRGELMAGN
jgi:hypothetical protein